MPDIHGNLDVVVPTSLWEGLPCVFSGMAQSVLRLIADKDVRHKMRARGKTRAMEFDIGTSVDTVDSTYREHLKTL